MKRERDAQQSIRPRETGKTHLVTRWGQPQELDEEVETLQSVCRGAERLRRTDDEWVLGARGTLFIIALHARLVCLKNSMLFMCVCLNMTLSHKIVLRCIWGVYNFENYIPGWLFSYWNEDCSNYLTELLNLWIFEVAKYYGSHFEKSVCVCVWGVNLCVCMCGCVCVWGGGYVKSLVVVQSVMAVTLWNCTGILWDFSNQTNLPKSDPLNFTECGEHSCGEVSSTVSNSYDPLKSRWDPPKLHWDSEIAQGFSELY